MSSPPTTLGKYQIIREIARSNDIVYEAYDPLMNRRVALKELSMPNGSTPQQRDERISRFKREARAAGTLAHPNIMTVYELGEEGDRFYIAMEFLDGHTLRNEIDTKGAIPMDRALDIAKDVLSGLDFMHGKGIIHRDIKPDNIQLLSDGRVKLTDFGIARLTFEPNLTMDGQVFGTPSYMSPEQVVGREIDQRSDLFSLAIVLYEMIGGKKPFIGDSVVSITYAIMNKEPERLTECNYALWQVIERALDKSPALRYASAQELESALDAAQSASKAGPVLDVAPPPQIAGSYGAAGNPYMIPTPGVPPAYSSGPAPPPVLYPYNPYAAPSVPQPGISAQQNAYMGSSYVPNPAGMPIYYPPPPRAPMMKPETRQFLGRLTLALVIGATAVLVLILIISAIAQMVKTSANVKEDREIAQAINNGIAGKPISEQIKTVDTAIGDPDRGIPSMFHDDSIRDQEQHYAAQLHQERGERYFATRDYSDAEQDFGQAIQLDPTNSQYFRGLGEVYSQQALEIADARSRAALWRGSSENYIQAARVESDPVTRSKLQDGAATATYNYATQLYETGEWQNARQQLLGAQKLAKPHTELSQRIEQFLHKVPDVGLDTTGQPPVNQ